MNKRKKIRYGGFAIALGLVIWSAWRRDVVAVAIFALMVLSYEPK